jgi:3-oxoadipate enol-lactonase
MPKAQINGIAINYFLEGEGDQTLVILNGIMMSASSWNDFVPLYTKRGYRLLRVDFRDQGLSDKSPRDYDINQHVEDLKELFDYLKIDTVNMLGISYGGQVAMLFALKYPSRLTSLILANTTTKINNYLKAIGTSWDEAAKLYDGEKFFKIAMPLIYSDEFYKQNYQWLEQRQVFFGKVLTKEWFEGYLRLSSSHGNYNIEDKIDVIKVPTLVIASDRDMVTPVSDLLEIHKSIKDSRLVIIPNCGHASCYEKFDEFNIQILGFLALYTN